MMFHVKHHEEKMKTKTTIIISSVIILLSLLAGVLLWNQLPESMASHWNEQDQVNGYVSKFWGVFLMPMITSIMLFMFLIIPNIDPLKANIEQFREYFNTFIALITIFMAYIYGLTLAWNLGYHNFQMSTAMLPALGLLFVFTGVMISRARRNFFIGIRTPWTLSSENVWNETHRLGGKLYITAGLLTLMGLFFQKYAFWLMMISIIGASLISVIFSYWLYQKERKQN